MIASGHTDKFAAYLRMLKDRTGRGFDKLGKQSGVSASSLHRYCSGASVPADYRVVHSFAKACGASPEELRELHQLWALADAARIEAPQPGPPQPEPAEPEPAEPEPVVQETPTVQPQKRRLSPKLIVPIAAAVVLLIAGIVWATTGNPQTAKPHAKELLFSPACQSVIMGQHDDCVSEVQRLLKQAHARLSVDGDFGPETLRRVTAFQVLANLQARGVVDEPTKNALYDQKVSMETWSPQEVEKKVREVFTEDPDTAVKIAKCASFLDPLHVLPNTNGSRNWGVFQISDNRLRELDGTPRKAFEPAWNIEAAHRLWSVKKDFHDWPACEAAIKTAPQSNN
ncbi:helix-turn-helix domain-containing protein [Lentzea sp. NBRC 105346]|uniref:helix-turn-helix domain-containing protein n=1 Tax=Lentzea sp. NBRC 105346 TaxID=3032205 RepID=UPI002552D5A8|nr:helix-turn-helix domain-containing protein [Lentzea sp. NBRC 105346]